MTGRRGALLSLIAIAVISHASVAEVHPVVSELRRTFASVSLDSSAQFESAQCFVGARLTSGLRARSGGTAQAETLSVLYPQSYDGLLIAELGSQRVVLRAMGAVGSPAIESSGKLVYTKPYPSTDVVEVPNNGRSEELLLLRDQRAPMIYEYEIVATDGIAAVALDDGAIRFLAKLDPTSAALSATGGGHFAAPSSFLQIDRPWLIDASGQRTESETRWTLIGEGSIPKAIRLTIEPQRVAFPLLVDPSFSQTGGTSTAHFAHTSTLLANGKVLIVGGPTESSAELYDPFNGTFTTIASTSIPRLFRTATLLRNGKVLIAGGWDGNAAYFASAELYDPNTNTFSATGSLANARFYHTATLLADGKVLVAGGRNSTGFLSSAELYDPASGAFSPTGSLATARNQHTATRLPGGEVLFAGGYNGSDLTSAELYDPATGTFSGTGSLAFAREDHTATLLPNGKVLVAGGGLGGSTAPVPVSLMSAELYDSSSGTFISTGNLTAQRNSHTATLLSNGKVLIAGGYDGANVLTSAEVYDASVGTFNGTGSLVRHRMYHTATLLPNGRVLMVGGTPIAIGVGAAELYEPDGTFSTATGRLATARDQHTATVLLNGKVLIAGGHQAGPYFASAELYDPASGAFTATGSLLNGRASHTATLLPDGKVLVAGGYNGGPLTSAELYDPSSGTFTTTTGSLATGRYSPTATLLADGKVLIAGGYNGGYLASAELYEPSSGTFSATTGSLATARMNHTATLLPNGDVLIVGGYNGAVTSSAEVYDPNTGSFSATGSMTNARDLHTATLLPHGNVLIAGGIGASNQVPSTELYDPTSGTFGPTASLITPRYGHTATLLANGNVLIAGGRGNSGYLSAAELYDPSVGTFSATGSLATRRFSHTATLLTNGNVLVAGGLTPFAPGTNPYLDSAELYDPGLGFTDARRPVISSAPASLNLPGDLTLLGNGFLGDSEASSGGTNSSRTNYPVVQLERIDNEQVLIVAPNSDLMDTTWSASLGRLAIGPYRATVFTNGIPSMQQLVKVFFAAPTITKAFGAVSIPLNGITTLTFNLSNPNAATSLSGVGFSDPFPTGVAVATPNGLTGSCGGGTISAAAGATSVSLSDATIDTSGSCTFSVNVIGTIAGHLVNTTGNVSSTNGGSGDTATASIDVVSSNLTITKTHAGNFTQGQIGRTYTIVVTNAGNGTSNGTASVTDNLPAGLKASSISGTGWMCDPGVLTCTRNDALAAGSSYAPITLVVNVASNAAASVTNIAALSAGGAVKDTAYDLTVVNPAVLAAPTNLVATADSAAQITVRWDALPMAAKYQVYRTHDNMPFSGLGVAITATTLIDSDVAPNTTYVYIVEAVDAANNTGLPSNLDIATTVIFTDDPVVGGSTLIKAVHLTELRAAVNAVRTAAGLPAVFTDPDPSGLVVTAADITDLRSSLDAARSVLGLAAIPYTDPQPGPGAVIRGAHMQELRAGVN